MFKSDKFSMAERSSSHKNKSYAYICPFCRRILNVNVSCSYTVDIYGNNEDNNILISHSNVLKPNITCTECMSTMICATNETIELVNALIDKYAKQVVIDTGDYIYTKDGSDDSIKENYIFPHICIEYPLSSDMVYDWCLGKIMHRYNKKIIYQKFNAGDSYNLVVCMSEDLYDKESMPKYLKAKEIFNKFIEDFTKELKKVSERDFGK